MIFTRFAGGLGNQLFQFAAALALRGTQGNSLYLGTESLNHYKVKRTFDLARLVSLPVWCLSDGQSRLYSAMANHLMTLRVGRVLPYFGVNDRNFKRVLAVRGLIGQPKTIWLDGYFQYGWEWRFFQSSLATIKSMLRIDLPTPNSNAPDCVIHVRGSDFLGSELHRVVDGAYYVRAFEVLQGYLPQVNTASVITDDQAYAVAIINKLSKAYPAIQFNLTSLYNADWLYDFMLLRNARSRIIGNSSFSWWAAALDPDQAITVTPSRWLKGVSRDLFLPWEIPLQSN